MCFAPAIPPAIAAFHFSKALTSIKLRSSVRKLNYNRFNFAAVSKTPFMVLEPVTFTAGRAKPFSFA
jgi:hypothetical protein